MGKMMRFLPETLDLDESLEDVGTTYVGDQEQASSALERITFDTWTCLVSWCVMTGLI